MRTAWCTVFKMCGSICSQLVSSPFSACDSTFTLSGKRTCLQRNCSYKHAAGLTEMCLFLWVFSFNKELHRRGRRKVIWTSARSDNSCSEIASFLSLADFQQAIKKKISLNDDNICRLWNVPYVWHRSLEDSAVCNTALINLIFHTICCSF